jgi:hypothetical protein
MCTRTVLIVWKNIFMLLFPLTTSTTRKRWWNWPILFVHLDHPSYWSRNKCVLSCLFIENICYTPASAFIFLIKEKKEKEIEGRGHKRAVVHIHIYRYPSSSRVDDLTTRSMCIFSIFSNLFSRVIDNILIIPFQFTPPLCRMRWIKIRIDDTKYVSTSNWWR